MPDDFQQFKGLLGQQIAKLHLQRIRCWSIADEEVKVEECKIQIQELEPALGMPAWDCNPGSRDSDNGP